jgi:hypothetical protein
MARMSDSQSVQHTAGVIARTLRLMLGGLFCWMTYTVMSAETTPFNLTVLWVFGGILIFFLLVHLVICRYGPNLHRWLGAFLVALPLIVLFVFGGQPGRVAAVGYVGIALLLLAAKGNSANEVLFIPALLSGKATHLRCLLLAPIDLVEQHLGGPGGMPG